MSEGAFVSDAIFSGNDSFQVRKMKPVRKHKFFLSMLTALFLFHMGTANAMSEPCRVDANDSEGLLRCYQNDYNDKLVSNDQKYRGLILKAKRKLLSENQTKQDESSILSLMRQLSRKVVESRKSAAINCAHIAGKFQSAETSQVAAVNCRADRENQLEKDIVILESQLAPLLKSAPRKH